MMHVGPSPPDRSLGDVTIKLINAAKQKMIGSGPPPERIVGRDKTIS
jgi:hypothetical protein